MGGQSSNAERLEREQWTREAAADCTRDGAARKCTGNVERLSSARLHVTALHP
jgi:hypothetical protein